MSFPGSHSATYTNANGSERQVVYMVGVPELLWLQISPTAAAATDTGLCV